MAPTSEAKMSQLRKELDILLWAPPVLIVLGAIYAAVSMWMARQARRLALVARRSS